MTNHKATEDLVSDTERVMTAIEGVVRILGPLESEARHRVIQGALVILREAQVETAAQNSDRMPQTEADVVLLDISSRARIWMKQNNLKDAQIAEVFDISDGETSIIASGISGKNNSDKTIKAYVLAGIASFLSSGDTTFNDRFARSFCETLGCYDRTNHSKYMKDKGSNFLGDKDRGWKLTAPGLKYGALIVKDLSGAGDA